MKIRCRANGADKSSPSYLNPGATWDSVPYFLESLIQDQPGLIPHSSRKAANPAELITCPSVSNEIDET